MADSRPIDKQLDNHMCHLSERTQLITRRLDKLSLDARKQAINMRSQMEALQTRMLVLRIAVGDLEYKRKELLQSGMLADYSLMDSAFTDPLYRPLQLRAQKSRCQS